MGYTHYMTQKATFTGEEWSTITRDIQTILDFARGRGLRLGDTWGKKEITGGEAVSNSEIAFNGFADESCETFYVTKERPALKAWQKPEMRGWSFCKTNRRAYDPAVMACLIYLEGTHPDKFSAASDGTPSEWNLGLNLVRDALGTRAVFAAIPAEVLREDAEWNAA